MIYVFARLIIGVAFVTTNISCIAFKVIFYDLLFYITNFIVKNRIISFTKSVKQQS